jgi:hypothetical protein
MALPSLVREVCSEYLEHADAETPGLVTGLYLIGSLALGGYRHGRSDIDFLAVTSRRPGGEDVAGLSRLHAEMARRHRRPVLDGVYLRAADLSRPPDGLDGAVRANLGTVSPGDHYEPNPVTMHLLIRRGIAFRGPDVLDLGLRDDPSALRRWVAENLVTYWKPWVARWSRSFGPKAMGGWPVEWAVLGVSRLHFTLTSGDICTKEEAARYASRRFGGQWDGILDEALRLRARGRGGYHRPSLMRRRDAVDFVRMVIADGERLGPH